MEASRVPCPRDKALKVKYARAVTLTPRFTDFFTDFEKKTTVIYLFIYLFIFQILALHQ